MIEMSCQMMMFHVLMGRVMNCVQIVFISRTWTTSKRIREKVVDLSDVCVMNFVQRSNISAFICRIALISLMFCSMSKLTAAFFLSEIKSSPRSSLALETCSSGSSSLRVGLGKSSSAFLFCPTDTPIMAPSDETSNSVDEIIILGS